MKEYGHVWTKQTILLSVAARRHGFSCTSRPLFTGLCVETLGEHKKESFEYMANTLFGFAKIAPKPEHYTDARDAILAIVEETRAEAGCIEFIVLTNADQRHIFLFEQWQDEAALKEHHGKPYTKAVMDNYDHWLAEPLRFETMIKVI